MKKDHSSAKRIFIITTISLFVVFFIVCIVQLVFITSYRNKQNGLEKSLKELQTQVGEYEKQLEEVTSEDYLDRYAREHGYVKEGEQQIENTNIS